LLALDKNLPQWTRIRPGSGLFEGAPFHQGSCPWLVAGCPILCVEYFKI
jgi:hypothetical protein